MKGFAKAPRKIIITGTHFVIHGSNALAAAIEKEKSHMRYFLQLSL